VNTSADLALRDLLPAEIIKRFKQPYRAPDTQSFFEQGREQDYVANLLSAKRVEKSDYFDVPTVSHLLDKCRAGRAIGFADYMAFVGRLSTMLPHQSMVPGRSI
jgi:asparagine synthase (glutamine-hydrolysing)